MKGMLKMIGMSVGGGIGWWLGDFVGMTTAVILSGIFSGLGLYAVIWLQREYLE